MLNGKLQKANDSTFGALFSSIMQRGGPSVEEVSGLMDVVLHYDRKVSGVPRIPGTVGIVGSGKDDLKTFNVSTGAALVAAACGIKIVKNGSRSESGVSGTTDMMEIFGVNVGASRDALANCLRRAGIVFVDAQKYFPLMNRVYVGKFLFINPLSFALSIASGVDFERIVFGLANKDVVFTAKILRNLGYTGSLVVNGLDRTRRFNIDEISVVGPTRIADIGDNGRISSNTIWPKELGISVHQEREIRQGETVIENAQILLKAISRKYGKKGHGPTDIVAVNAAAAISLRKGDGLTGIRATLDDAYSAIESGQAIETLYRLVDSSSGDSDQLENLLKKFRIS